MCIYKFGNRWNLILKYLKVLGLVYHLLASLRSTNLLSVITQENKRFTNIGYWLVLPVPFFIVTFNFRPRISDFVCSNSNNDLKSNPTSENSTWKLNNWNKMYAENKSNDLDVRNISH